MNNSEIHAFMKSCRYGIVSSLSPEGMPQSALVGIAATPELEVVFDTVTTSRKYRNLKARPACSLVMGCEDERTLQYEGIATEPEGSELQRFQEAYFAAWPDGRARLNWFGIAYFVVRPCWIPYSDFKPNPPLIEETTFPYR